MQRLVKDESYSIDIKALDIRQLTAILALSCTRPGFPVVNRHLRVDELAGLGWWRLQPLLDDPQEGKAALKKAISALVTFSPVCELRNSRLSGLQPQLHASSGLSMSPDSRPFSYHEAMAASGIRAHLQESFGARQDYIESYSSTFEQALNGEALDIFRDARRKYVFCLDSSRCRHAFLSPDTSAFVPSLTVQCDMTRSEVPQFLAYDLFKAPVVEGPGRKPMFLIYCWPRALHFPAAPVFHGQTVTSGQTQYGEIGMKLNSKFPGVRPTNEKACQMYICM